MLMQGIPFEQPKGTDNKYTGLGTTTSKGRVAIPIALRLSNGVVMQGVVNSNEIAGADALPLCFSLLAQMTLGLVKCMRAGMSYVPDCEGELQLFEVKGSRLRAVCINEFATADEVESSRTVGVKTETFRQSTLRRCV